LEAIHPWTRPFFIELAQYSLSTSNFGLILRVCSGAGLSSVDLASDVFITYLFLTTEGMEEYGQMNAAIIGVTLGIQILIAHVQNNGKFGLFLKESLIIILGLKPAYDAWRVGMGVEPEEHHVFDPMFEMTFCKCVETVFEAIPSSIVQMYALLASGNSDKVAIFSILISGATTAFASVMVAYDWDTSPAKRAQNNKNIMFYGFVPDRANPRFVCFAAMLLLTTAHTLSKTFSCALLAAVHKRWLVIYLAVDMFLYFAYKFARGDFIFGINTAGVASYVLSFIIRLGEKVMIDFCAMVQLRHPGQAGGLYWTASLIMAQISCFVCGGLYLKHAEDRDGKKLDPFTIYGTIGLLCCLFLTGSIAFLLVCNKDFLSSFFSTDDYSTYTRKWFLGIPEGDDEARAGVFSVHPKYRWKIEAEIKAWTLVNWERFEREKPKFFTNTWIDSVPNGAFHTSFA
jgi:hypothetical protein